jgi:hypothetical protein
MSDIYSLGMIVFEITTGEKNAVSEDRSGRKFVDNVTQHFIVKENVRQHYLVEISDLYIMFRCFQLIYYH